tara:strand:+ start:489 stop:728 length:240 start_codon:yes stop_codon:yes gene_type:complete
MIQEQNLIRSNLIENKTMIEYEILLRKVDNKDEWPSVYTVEAMVWANDEDSAELYAIDCLAVNGWELIHVTTTGLSKYD